MIKSLFTGNLSASIVITLIFISLTSCSDENDLGPGVADYRYTVFSNVNLIPMTDEIVIKGQTVIVEGSNILEIGSSDEVNIPDDAELIDGSGLYLLPGLSDMHMHTREDWLTGDWRVSPLKLYLANGVTTVRDFSPNGTDMNYPNRWREEIEDGTLIGPTLYTSGIRLFASPIEDVQGVIQENHVNGFDFQKIYSYISYDDFQAAMSTAGQLGMYTAGHVPYSIGLDSVIAGGMDEIAHIEELVWEFVDFDRNSDLSWQEWLPYLIGSVIQQVDIYAGFDRGYIDSQKADVLTRVINDIVSANIPICTTIIIDDRIVEKLFEPGAFLSRPEIVYMPQRYLDNFNAGEEKHQVQFRGIEDLATYKYGLDKMLLDELHKAGAILLLSTDAGTGGMGIVPGYSIHDELRILVENGFTPYEAIVTGTVNAAMVVEAMNGGGDFGTIEVGKRADMLLINGNPLEDIANIKNINGVIAAGRWYSRNELDRMIALEN